MEFSISRKSAFLLLGVAGAMGLVLFSAGCLVGIVLWAPTRADIQLARKSKAVSPVGTQTPSRKPPAMVETPSRTVVAESVAPTPVARTAAPVEAAKGVEPAPAASEADAYSVQVGAFRDAAHATKLVGELKDRYPLATIFTSSDAEKRLWHAVRIGSYKNLDAAMHFAADFTNKEQRQAFVRPSSSL